MFNNLIFRLRQLRELLGGGRTSTTTRRSFKLEVFVLEDRLAPTVTLANPGTQNNWDGDVVNCSLVATDTSANENLTFSGGPFPQGLSLSSGGIIAGTIASWAHGNSPLEITVTATDSSTFESYTQSFTWNVSQPTNTLANSGTQNNFVGDAISLQLNASEDAGHSLMYNVTGGGLPAGLTLDPTNGLIFGTISSMAYELGPYSVTVTATDSAADVSDGETFT